MLRDKLEAVVQDAADNLGDDRGFIILTPGTLRVLLVLAAKITLDEISTSGPEVPPQSSVQTRYNIRGGQ